MDGFTIALKSTLDLEMCSNGKYCLLVFGHRLDRAGLSTLPHFAGDSRIFSISPSLPHREERELQVKKAHLSGMLSS